MGKRALWLEDLYIEPEFRGKGIGSAVMAHLANIAIENRCARFEWIVLDWNARAIDFYRGLGATVLPDWRICRVAGKQLEAIANGGAG
jgi:ribosomal protein S18 acetylase RimI-like enzyme